MIEEFGNSMGEGGEKMRQDVLSRIAEYSGETLEVYKSAENEYAMRTDTLENLVLRIDKDTITVVDIEARNQGEGGGANMIQALVATADELGCRLYAENVMPEFDSWWRSQGFAPPEESEHSADYEYHEQNLA